MTYPLLVVPFVLITAAVTALSARRPGFGRRMRASLVTAVVLLVLTAVFDNVMIATGLFYYSPDHLLGVHIGLAPLEDFAYPLAGAVLLPTLWAALRARRRARAGLRGAEEDPS